MDMCNNEFRARLSLVTSPLSSSIRFSKARIEWLFVSRPILVSALRQRREMPQPNAFSYTDTNAVS